MRAPTLAEVLRNLAFLAEIRGSSEAIDLRAAVAVVDGLSPSASAALIQDARAGTFTPFPQLSPSGIRAVREIVCAGADAVTTAARARLPQAIRRLLELSVLSCEEAALLVRNLSVVTPADLELALVDGRVARLGGIAADRLTRGAERLFREDRATPLGRALEMLEHLQELIASRCPEFDATWIAGDVRRFEPLTKSLVLVGRASDPPAAIDALAALRNPEEIRHRSGRRLLVAAHQAEIDIRAAAADDLGTVLFAATGTPAHIRLVAARSRRPELCAREEELYAHAGLAWIPPEIRAGAEEVDAATSGSLPPLVRVADIRGDLHMHSTYSDGQDTVESMVLAARALHYGYVAITDHSEGSGLTRSLTADDLARQRDEIFTLRERYPDIAILHGIELEILPDGRLDVADAVLERLDIVLASLHDSAGQDGAALTRRCLRALRHPLVNVLTHPSNQLVGRRPGYPLRYEELYAAAAETGTALEIDGAPSHLDLDGEHARAAVAAGVSLTVDSDCHRAGALARQMAMGVGTARRGWIEARHVLNTRPLEDVLTFVRAKRARG